MGGSASRIIGDQGAPVATRPQGLTSQGDRRSPGRVPRWRLAREGPFLNEWSSTVLSLFGAGCAFRNATYRASDYDSPLGEFGVPLNHPRFLEWIAVPESASLAAGYCFKNDGEEPRIQ